MGKRSITLVAGSNQTMTTLVNQLRAYVGDDVEIHGYAFDDGIQHEVSDDLVVISSDLAMQDLVSLNLLDMNADRVVAMRAINYDYLDQVVAIPNGTRILLVNDVKEATLEVISHLKRIGIDSIEYVPYYPGCDFSTDDIQIAITPGEVDKVPSGIETIIDIGPRIMDFTTITKILTKLKMLDEKAGMFSQFYLEKIINIAKRLAESRNRIFELNNHLENVIDGLSHGLLVYDQNGRITVFNETLKGMIHTNQRFLVGKPLKRVIFNTQLLEYLMNPGETQDQIMELDGVGVIVSKVPTDQGSAVLASFRRLKEAIDENDRIKREYIKRGLYAKYTLDDIIGRSAAILKVKEITRKLGKSDLTILIEGESGTGKELFASAIHNVSSRHMGPFLAVNFSALPDDLIESELFGYEEGAFTGAKKGGKVGLFEQADGGTIFLDEIGDISLKVQARLLRVLQEKEIMRIGGSEIKPIDVRVVAATNRDLRKMVEKGTFREDLYYRLKMGYLKLPPLRERKVDIPDILNYFAEIEMLRTVIFEDRVLDVLQSYEWYGNVRELRNTFSYMLAVAEGNILTMDYIPDKGFFQSGRPMLAEIADHSPQKSPINDEMAFILEAINHINESSDRCGRAKLSELSQGTPFAMSPSQMRNRLEKLERMGLVLKRKGRHGTILTNEGMATLMAHNGSH